MFRSSHTLSINFDAATLSPQRYHTKIQAVAIAFLGATGQGDLVSCKIEHGRVYSERGGNGAMHETVLGARYEIIPASVTKLRVNNFDIDSSPPLEDPQNSPLWGMGIGGL